MDRCHLFTMNPLSLDEKLDPKKHRHNRAHFSIFAARSNRSPCDLRCGSRRAGPWCQDAVRGGHSSHRIETGHLARGAARAMGPTLGGKRHEPFEHGGITRHICQNGNPPASPWLADAVLALAVHSQIRAGLQNRRAREWSSSQPAIQIGRIGDIGQRGAKKRSAPKPSGTAFQTKTS